MLMPIYRASLVVIAAKVVRHHIEPYGLGMGWHNSSYVSQGRCPNTFGHIVYVHGLGILVTMRTTINILHKNLRLGHGTLVHLLQDSRLLIFTAINVTILMKILNVTYTTVETKILYDFNV